MSDTSQEKRDEWRERHASDLLTQDEVERLAAAYYSARSSSIISSAAEGSISWFAFW
jgi:hypothetical protein